LLGLPLVKVKAEHRLRIDANGARVESGVTVANVRGRPVEVVAERSASDSVGSERADARLSVATQRPDASPNRAGAQTKPIGPGDGSGA
jgi:hypothetical protein